MSGPTSALLLAQAGLITATILYGWSWLRQTDSPARVGFKLAQVTAALLVAGLGWQGVARGHIPPTGLDEQLVALAALALLVFLALHARRAAPASLATAGLLLNNGLLGWGIYLALTAPPFTGLEPAWPMALPGRWLILGGAAGLYWTAVEALLAWTQGHPRSRRRVCLTPPATLALSTGIPLFAGWSWWRGGITDRQTLGLAALLLLAIAVEWLNFARPARRRLQWSLTILAFVAALPALSAIAV
ncbi:MAG: hypothetical protein ACE5G8_17900 [Anaerolineae bacterium]